MNGLREHIYTRSNHSSPNHARAQEEGDALAVVAAESEHMQARRAEHERALAAEREVG